MTYPCERCNMDEGSPVCLQDERCPSKRPVPERDYIRAQVAPGRWENVPKRCEHCDDTGDVTGRDGEWRGYCTCAAGQALKAPPPSDHDCALKRGSVMCRVCDLNTIAAASKTPNSQMSRTEGVGSISR